MIPVEPHLCNVKIAEHQEEYITLPAYLRPGSVQGEAITCWKLSDEEKEIVAKTGKIYLSQWRFGKPLQPVMLTACPKDVYTPEELDKILDEHDEKPHEHEKGSCVICGKTTALKMTNGDFNCNGPNCIPL